jgi:cell division septum initiation protein DivIVA
MTRRIEAGKGRQPTFRIRFRGFDRTEVVAALAKLAAENEDACREIELLGDEIDRLQAAITNQSDNERHAQRALVAASRLADEIRGHAEEEALQIRREAEADGELILQRLHDKARRLEEQIDGLLARRSEIEASLGSFLKVIYDELERVRQQQRDESAGAALAETG